jgi:DnaJ-class molecular chaperone
MICPRCKGNGYFKVKQDVYTKKDIVVQCPQCKSKGEIEDENPSYDYSGIDTNKLQ